MKRCKLLFALLFFTGLMACNQAENETTTEAGVANQEAATEAEASSAPERDVDALVQEIDQLRASIEANAADPLEVSTADLRAKVKQKWEKIEFYTDGDQVVRIKTYPYAQISRRTEEFYFSGGELVLAVIEDDGSGERGKSAEAIDKMYYYHEGELLKETSDSEEEEYSIRESDAEELLQEVREYVATFRQQTAENPVSDE